MHYDVQILLAHFRSASVHNRSIGNPPPHPNTQTLTRAELYWRLLKPHLSPVHRMKRRIAKHAKWIQKWNINRMTEAHTAMALHGMECSAIYLRLGRQRFSRTELQHIKQCAHFANNVNTWSDRVGEWRKSLQSGQLGAWLKGSDDLTPAQTSMHTW